MRVTIVASRSGTEPSRNSAPTIIGTPARQTLSLSATRRPSSLPPGLPLIDVFTRSEEHTSELQSHSFIPYAVFCLKKTNQRRDEEGRCALGPVFTPPITRYAR